MNGRQAIVLAVVSLLLVALDVRGADNSQLLAALDSSAIESVNAAQLQDFQAHADPAALDPATDAQPGQTIYARQLVGLVVNGIEQPAITAWFDGRQYLLPLATVVEIAAIRPLVAESAENSGAIRLNTPGGVVSLTPSDLKIIAGQLLIEQAALADKLMIGVRFDQASFGIVLDLPWDLPADGVVGQAANEQQVEPAFVPPAASLRNLRADLSYTADGADGYLSGDYFAAGNLANGTWRFRVRQDEEGEGHPLEYFWSGSGRNSQTLLGNSDFSLHPLLPTVEQTGLQVLYSSAPVARPAYRTTTGLNSNRAISNGIRTIEGTAVPGAVAALRIDGSVIARTRVRLDGSFDFPDVELPTRGYTEVLVDILERGTGTLLERQNFSRRSGIELLAGNQHSLFAAIGSEGNLLRDDRDSLGPVSAAQWRYGVTEDLTIELGHQQAGRLSGTQAGVSVALFNNWFASVGYGTTIDRDSVELNLEGGTGRWTFDLRAREFQLSRESELNEGSRQWSRFLNFRYEFTDGLTLGLVGRDVSNSFDNRRYLLPVASWSNRRNLSVSAYPTLSGNYRLDSRFSPTRYDIARYAFENDRHLLDYRHRNGRGQEYYANVRTGKFIGDRIEAGVVHYGENALLGRIQLGLVSDDGGFGYTLDWESRMLPGFNSRLRLATGASGFGAYDEQESDDLFLQWNMTLDFAVAQKRVVPADSSWGNFDSAALTGEVLLGGRRVTGGDSIERIELIIDGDSRTALVQGGRYYIDGLEPGLHKISIDSRHLPIELMPGDNQDYWVRLEAAAATEMPILLEARYVIAGRVQNVAGDNVVGLQLSILNEAGRKVGEAYTDQFGLYRADALAPGSYFVIAEKGGERLSAIAVNIVDSFLFEQDLVVP